MNDVAAPRPLRVGLAGAGPWAHLFTAPMIAGAADVTFAGVWARRADAAEELAAKHSVTGTDDFDAFLDLCDAVVFSLPPDVQAHRAAIAAECGKALLLDKPTGCSADQAERLADAVGAAGVVSQLLLTNRYTPEMRDFLNETSGLDIFGVRAAFYGNGSIPGEYFATPWRVSEGALLDLGAHVFDALEAVAGPIVELRATGDSHRTVFVEARHADGTPSQAAMSATTREPGGLRVEVHSAGPHVCFDASARTAGNNAAQNAAAVANIMNEFVSAVRSGVPHQHDVLRGLALQRLIDAAIADIAR